MGFFDVNTQRRTENCEETVLLPAAEVLPQLAPGGLSGLVERMEGLIARVRRRRGKSPTCCAIWRRTWSG